MTQIDYNQWSTVRRFSTPANMGLSWIPKIDQDRIASYIKYDQMYWNDNRQFALRVLDDEEPLYIPNARIIVDATAQFWLKGLQLTVESAKGDRAKETPQAGVERTKVCLDEFLKREVFYSRFNTAKHAGVARGDFVFHLTANPRKPEGKRLSLNSVDPSSLFPIFDEDEPDKMVGCHIAVQYTKEDKPGETFVRRLTYRLIEDEQGNRRISRSEAIYSLNEGSWWNKSAKLVRTLIPEGLLDPEITAIPIYWFKNRHWDGEDFGSSELRGLETLIQTVSQGSTDVSAALALEGLGVYATDGGRPVMDDGQGGVIETDWEVAPGKVMEVPTGSYFRRVEGVSSITPATDQIDYLEGKANDAAGLSDVALGKVDAQIATSGIALAIRFMPTLAKIETRDQHGIDILTQLFYDWKTWYAVFERETLVGDIIPVIGDKLPTDRVAKQNELNNMFDRGLIPQKFYRDEMEKLGYKFPEDIEDQLAEEAEAKVEQARAAFLATKDTSAEEGGGTPSTEGGTLPSAGNRSNNRNRPNESSGTEAKTTRDA